MKTQEIKLVCIGQMHNLSNISEKQIEKVSQSLSASANYLRKLVGDIKTPQPQVAAVVNPIQQDNTIAVHGVSSYEDALVGFSSYDAGNYHTPAYTSRRAVYDAVRKEFPSLNSLKSRDERVTALEALKRAGFKYYSVFVIAFVRTDDGLTNSVYSKAHCRLERPGVKALEDVLVNFFNARIIEPPVEEQVAPVDIAEVELQND